MTKTKLSTLLLLPALLGTGCVQTYARSRSWGEAPYQGQQQSWERIGRVTNVRETVYGQHGDPADQVVQPAVVEQRLVRRVVANHEEC